MRLKDYINKNFKNLTLKSSLFYNWKYGIRFETGYLNMWLDNEQQYLNFEYSKQGLVRAEALFNFLFDGDDDIFVVCQRYSDGRQKIKKQSFCFKNIYKYNRVESYKIKDPYYEEDREYTKKEHWHRVIFSCQVKDINHKEFLKHSIEYDFRYIGSQEVYFINKSKNIIFHNYDDRGLDVIATEPKALKSLYDKFNGWILDYDRLEIDKIFSIK